MSHDPDDRFDEDAGPTEAQIEDEMIEAQIEAEEEGRIEDWIESRCQHGEDREECEACHALWAAMAEEERCTIRTRLSGS
jgi:hypothetical protein